MVYKCESVTIREGGVEGDGIVFCRPLGEGGRYGGVVGDDSFESQYEWSFFSTDFFKGDNSTLYGTSHLNLDSSLFNYHRVW